MVPQPMLPCLLELPWPNSALTYLILLFQIINTYTEAVQTVDPFKATGKPHTLWVAFAKFYEDNGQLDDVSELHYACICVQVFSPWDLGVAKWQGLTQSLPITIGPCHPREGHQGKLQASG